MAEIFDMIITDAMMANPVKGVIYIQSYQITPNKKDGREYVAGTIKKQKKTLNFKIWDSAIVKLFKDNDFSKQLAVASLKGAEWQGNKYVTITALHLNEVVEVDMAEFECTLDCDALFNEFYTYLKSKLEPKWLSVVDLAFKGATGIDAFDRFKREYAGNAYHDAIGGGLINHTLKMLKLYDTVESNDARIQPYSNLIRTGIILHDIGKIQEMHDGEYGKDAFIIPHQVLGIQYLERNRTEVLKFITEAELARLESVIYGHHNGLGGAAVATTIYAAIVHAVDNLDATVTHILDSLENPDNLKKAQNGDSQIWMGENSVFF